ncbi:hypothetical protein [Streptomyces sp. NPDC094049]|uniref:hypothetical protein n=1 Tax=Streptomyces sp. NPDC094049 TaxID=3154987 RepID=UPI00331B2B67
MYATGVTPVGPVVLTRGPGARSCPEAAADGWEDWTLALRGEPRLRIQGLGAPGHLSRKLLARGLDGVWDGEECRVRVASSLARSRRSASVERASVRVAFRPAGLRTQVVQGDEPQGSRSGGRWDLSAPTDTVVLGVCLFEWAEMDHFLRTPGLRQL